MKTSKEGINLVKAFEGFKADAYKCPAGIWTIGYGHTGDVKQGDKVSEAYATELLSKDLASAEKTVNSLVGRPLAQCQFDALVSFVYNCGPGNFKASTLLKKINADPNNFAEVRKQLLRWDKAAGKALAGLTRRRTAEADLYCKAAT